MSYRPKRLKRSGRKKVVSTSRIRKVNHGNGTPKITVRRRNGRSRSGKIRQVESNKGRNSERKKPNRGPGHVLSRSERRRMNYQYTKKCEERIEKEYDRMRRRKKKVNVEENTFNVNLQPTEEEFGVKNEELMKHNEDILEKNQKKRIGISLQGINLHSRKERVRFFVESTKVYGKEVGTVTRIPKRIRRKDQKVSFNSQSSKFPRIEKKKEIELSESGEIENDWLNTCERTSIIKEEKRKKEMARNGNKSEKKPNQVRKKSTILSKEVIRYSPKSFHRLPKINPSTTGPRQSERTEKTGEEVEQAENVTKKREKLKLLYLQVEYKRRLKLVKNVDLVFLCDIGSLIMSSVRKGMKVLEGMKKRVNGFNLRVGFVGVNYREVTKFPLTSEIERYEILLDQVSLTGGHNQTSNILGGISKINKLNWDFPTRLIIHLTDKPCFGSDFHNLYVEDDDESDLQLKTNNKSWETRAKSFNDLRQKRIQYFFFIMERGGRCTTKKMIRKFKEVYDGGGAESKEAGACRLLVCENKKNVEIHKLFPQCIKMAMKCERDHCVTGISSGKM